MKRIFKYELLVSDSSTWNLKLPRGAKILAFGNQGNPAIIVLWAEVDPAEVAKDTWRFSIYATGDAVPDGLMHMASVWARPYMWHVYSQEDNFAS